ncbi:MAG: hypothetical protein Q8K75_10730 [Chlamydiales bacterium]|nr:hypothetical protein [Chlamydiales bacterium]
MADQAAKRKKRKEPEELTKESPSAEGSIHELADSMVDDLTVATPPSLESVDQLRQRKKLEVMQELEDFRASFSRGYAVILAELAKKKSGESHKI